MSEDERNDIMRSMDDFIESVQHLRGILLGVSLSALILFPLAVGISLYLVTHPKFLSMLEDEDEFGFVLIALLIAMLVTSAIWLVAGLRQFKSLSRWNNRYCNYLKKRESLDKKISALSSDEE